MDQPYTWNTCQWLLQLLVVLHTLISASSGPLGTGCIWRSSISPTLPPEQECSPRPECPDGQLWWYYPKGNLSVTFEPESKDIEFELCIIKTLLGVSDEVYHIEGRKRHLLDLTKDFEDRICVKSHRGQVLLQFSSPQKGQRLKIIEYVRKDGR